MTRCRLGLVALLLCVLSGWARTEQVDRLAHTGFVSDFAGVMTAQQKAQLQALCAEIDVRTHAQIAVVTIRSLEDVPIEEFASRLFSKWGVGYKSENRGVLILLVVADHKYRIEVGYGLEPILPDGKVGGFGREIVPFLRQNDYGGALIQIAGWVAQVIAQDRGITLATATPAASAPGSAAASQGRGPAGTKTAPVILFVLLFFLLSSSILALVLWSIFRRIMGRPLPAWLNIQVGSASSSSSSSDNSNSSDSNSSDSNSSSTDFGGGESGGGGASGTW